MERHATEDPKVFQKMNSGFGMDSIIGDEVWEESLSIIATICLKAYQ